MIQNRIEEQKSNRNGLVINNVASRTLQNDGGATKNIVTMEFVGVPAVGDTVEFTVNAITLITAPMTAATLDDLALKAKKALQDDPLFSKIVPESTGAILTLTGRQDDVKITASCTRAGTVITEVAPMSLGSNLEQGIAVAADTFHKCRALKAADTSDKIVGVTIASVKEVDGLKRHAEDVAILTAGEIWVPVEVEVLISDPVFVRITADGNLDKIGGFSKAAGMGLIEFENAKWINYQDGRGLLKLSL